MPIITFLPWNRSEAYGRVTAPAGAFVRLRGRVGLTASDTMPGSAQAPVSGGVDVEILGPAEIRGFKPRAVTKMFPAYGARNCETTKMCFVELAAEDIPWRYTAEMPMSVHGRRLRPWCVLVVGPEQEMVRRGDASIEVSGAVLDTHVLDQSARWAHIQDGSPRIARILSPVLLQAFTKYRAALVPAFRVDGDVGAESLQNAWLVGGGTKVLKVLHSWDFETGSDEDFRALAAKLNPSLAPPDLGRAPLTYDRTALSHELQFRGALAPIGGTDAGLPAEVDTDVRALLQPQQDPIGRRVIGAPVYGGSWKVDPLTADWADEMNHDPRHRGAAGLGLASAITLQEEIMRAATEQLGALDIAAQYVRYLVFGLEASRRLWERRLPVDPAQRLQVFWPSLARMRTPAGSARDAIAGDGRPMPRGLFSSAARRILRPGTARTKLAAPTATAPDAIARRANVCPAPAPQTLRGLPHGEDAGRSLGGGSLTKNSRQAVADGRLPAQQFLKLLGRLAENGLADLGLSRRANLALGDLVGRAWQVLQTGSPLPYRAFVELLIPPDPRPAGDEWFLSRVRSFEFRPGEAEILELLRLVDQRPRPRDCRHVQLDAVIESVTAAIDPTTATPPAMVRVLGRIDGLGDQPLAPPELCVGLDLPMWRYLRDHAQDLLLLGASTIEDDAVHGVETNPYFVESFMVAANRQALGEMRWRNTPVAAGCTPLRVFWDRLDHGNQQRVDDIRGVAGWPDASGLAADSHRPPGVGAVNLVFVFRSQLFLRYPDTLVSLVPARRDVNGDVDWQQDPAADAPRILPAFQGRLGLDITFFGFETPPSEGRDKWLVLEEPPPGYLFRQQAATGTDGAEFASSSLERPTIVVLRGDSMIPEV